MGGDGAMFDIGFQNLSRALMAGKPIKVLIVDTQVYSNTGGQACTSGFIGQVADMSPYGASKHGKTEKRKEISIIGMAHRTSFVTQGSLANTTHLLESFIDGLNSRRPALFNVYAVCPPEHGVGDNSAVAQSKMAVESRAFPLFRYNPDLGVTFSECVTLEGNPALDADWPTYKLDYVDESGDKKIDDAADDVRRFRAERRALRQAVQEGAAGNLERRHGVAGRFSQAVRGRARRQVPVHLVGGQEEPSAARAGISGDGAFLRRALAVLASTQGCDWYRRNRRKSMKKTSPTACARN